jgi:hypothetical protein
MISYDMILYYMIWLVLACLGLSWLVLPYDTLSCLILCYVILRYIMLPLFRCLCLDYFLNYYLCCLYFFLLHSYSWSFHHTAPTTYLISLIVLPTTILFLCSFFKLFLNFFLTFKSYPVHFCIFHYFRFTD